MAARRKPTAKLPSRPFERSSLAGVSTPGFHKIPEVSHAQESHRPTRPGR